MLNRILIIVLALGLGGGHALRAQETPATPERQGVGFQQASDDVRRELEKTLEELSALRETIAGEKIPLNKQLNELEAELSQVRREFAEKTRELDSGAQDLLNLKSEIKQRNETIDYVSGLFTDYVGKLEPLLHISEKKRYTARIEAAKLAPQSEELSQEAVFGVQSEVVGASLDRLVEALGGARFEGEAVDPDGTIRPGTFVLVGPAALFRSHDGKTVGTAELKINSPEPAVIPFANPEATEAASQLVSGAGGSFPFDPTLGTAHKYEETKETFIDEFNKGGPVMYAIFGMAGLALLIAVFKWVTMAFVRKPSRRRVAALLEAVDRRDEESARREADGMPGPMGRMLSAGSKLLGHPRELIEEVMYEQVLKTRLRMQRLLPFIKICAASAPLLGLLGTVSGIINTFKTITVQGSGDVKSLSGGISEALITTKYGLIVAIPSLLLHAFLSRKARSVVGQMETTAVSFANRVSQAWPEAEAEAVAASPAPRAEAATEPVRTEKDRMRDQLRQMLGEVLDGGAPAGSRRDDGLTREAHA